MITRLPSHPALRPQQHFLRGSPGSSDEEGPAEPQPTYGVHQAACWGVAGVVLGTLLPWFDGVWEDKPGQEVYTAMAPVSGNGSIGHGGAYAAASASNGAAAPAIEYPRLATAMARTRRWSTASSASSTAASSFPLSSLASAPPDWALVIRGIGAFVGIAYAIRKLPWASTMQVSLTLALANPILWYLMDRSRPGLVLAAAAGLSGAVASLAGLVSPDVLPPPPTLASIGLVGLRRGRLGEAAEQLQGYGCFGVEGHADGHHQSLLRDRQPPFRYCLEAGEGMRYEAVEAGIWLLSLLFCSCIFFGNIGRRLALNESATGKGRWRGLK